MHGQYKSIINCTKCNSFSITFDPFSLISLSVPTEKSCTITYFFVPFDISKKISKGSLKIEKALKIDKLREIFSERHQISKYSFIMTMISAKTFDRFLCRLQSAHLISKIQNKSHSLLYLQEIDPEIVKSEEYLGLEKVQEERALQEKKNEELKTKETEDGKGISGSEEGKKYATTSVSTNGVYSYKNERSKTKKETVKDDDDFNQGLSENMIHVSVSIFELAKQMHFSRLSKERKTFNRILYFNKKETLKQCHIKILHYLRPLFIQALEKKDGEAKLSDLTDEELHAKLFHVVTEENGEKKIKEDNSPYQLRFVNVAEKSYFKKEGCYFCGSEDCSNCEVPFSSEKTLEEYINKIDPKNPPKNNYYYFKHNYYNEGKKDFEMEIVFNPDREKSIINLNMIEQVEEMSGAEKSETSSGSVSLYECFEQSDKWETLDENNLWYCSKCDENIAAKKRMEILRCPPILVIHLKRFKAKEYVSFSSGGKLNIQIDFPLEDLDLTKYIKNEGPSAIYDLFAVSNHYGTMGFGHYTAYALNNHKKRWYKFDDSSVSPASPEEVCSPAAYVLFYKRKDIGDEIDYEKIKQTLPKDFIVPVLSSTTTTPTPVEEPKSDEVKVTEAKGTSTDENAEKL